MCAPQMGFPVHMHRKGTMSSGGDYRQFERGRLGGINLQGVIRRRQSGKASKTKLPVSWM